MIARLVVFIGAAVYLGFTGSWGLAALALTGLIPGILGLVGAVVFAIALFLTQHYILGALVAVTVAFVFYLSNPQWPLRATRPGTPIM